MALTFLAGAGTAFLVTIATVFSVGIATGFLVVVLLTDAAATAVLANGHLAEAVLAEDLDEVFLLLVAMIISFKE